MAWLAVRIAAAVALVVVSFGYAVTGVHTEVLMGAGCGLAVGVGVGLRRGTQSGPWTGILIGAIVGIAVALIAGVVTHIGWEIFGPPLLALSVGLIDGLRGSSLPRYRDVSRETLFVSVLLALGFLPSFLAMGAFAAWAKYLFVSTCFLTPWIALMAGLLSRHRKGWRDARPPRWLVLGPVLFPVVFVFWWASGGLDDVGMCFFVVGLSLVLVVMPIAAFLLGRATATWLQPRLRVYGPLADYLRVMWVPIGGFAVGYLTIIVLFAGFYGMLERFSPGAFVGAGTGISEWVSFAFFNALGQDYTPIVPVSAGARMLVGAHLILSAGWALVLFAAVMSSIGPKLDRIARRHAKESSD